MADLNFPLNPQVNDLYTFNDRTFKYDGSKWRYVNVTLVTVTSGTAVTSINSLSNSAQDFAVGVSGSGFNVASTGNTHTFNIPTASAVNRGLLSSADYAAFSAASSGAATLSLFNYYNFT